jgi:hypothetical protein
VAVAWIAVAVIAVGEIFVPVGVGVEEDTGEGVLLILPGVLVKETVRVAVFSGV